MSRRISAPARTSWLEPDVELGTRRKKPGDLALVSVDQKIRSRAGRAPIRSRSNRDHHRPGFRDRHRIQVPARSTPGPRQPWEPTAVGRHLRLQVTGVANQRAARNEPHLSGPGRRVEPRFASGTTARGAQGHHGCPRHDAADASDPVVTFANAPRAAAPTRAAQPCTRRAMGRGGRCLCATATPFAPDRRGAEAPRGALGAYAHACQRGSVDCGDFSAAGRDAQRRCIRTPGP